MGIVFLWLMQRCAKKKKKRKGHGQERVMEEEEKYIFYINTQIKPEKLLWFGHIWLYLSLSDALVLDVNTGRNLLFQILLSRNGD